MHENDTLLISGITVDAYTHAYFLCPAFILWPHGNVMSLLCIQINKFATMQLSLVDPTCRPHKNRTHYYWSVPLTACGTVQQILPTDQITYKNAVSIYSDSFYADFHKYL